MLTHQGIFLNHLLMMLGLLRQWISITLKQRANKPSSLKSKHPNNHRCIYAAVTNLKLKPVHHQFTSCWQQHTTLGKPREGRSKGPERRTSSGLQALLRWRRFTQCSAWPLDLPLSGSSPLYLCSFHCAVILLESLLSVDAR